MPDMGGMVKVIQFNTKNVNFQMEVDVFGVFIILTISDNYYLFLNVSYYEFQ